MKYKFLSLIICVVSAFGIMSCTDDDSTLATGGIQNVNIQTPGLSDTLRVGYLDTLNISPVVSQGENAGTSDLSYLWEIADQSGTRNIEFDTLSTTKDLHAVISNDVNPSPYILRLTVTDNANGGLEYSKLWYVLVRSTFVDGIVVSSTYDGTTSDLSLVMDKDVTVGFTGDAKLYHNILFNRSGSSCGQLMTQLTHSVYGGSYTSNSSERELYAIGADGTLYRYNTENFSLDGTSREDNNEVFSYVGNNTKFERTFIANSFLFAVSDKGTYLMYTPTANIFAIPNSTVSAYPIDNGAVAARSRDANNYGVFWFDNEKGKIVSLSNAAGYMFFALDDDLSATSGVFDPNALSGYRAIAAGFPSLNTNEPAFLLRETSTGKYYIFTLSQYTEEVWNSDYTEMISPAQKPAAQSKIGIPEAGKQLLDNAVSVFFAQNQRILYIATADGLYAINFNGQTPEVYSTAKFTPAPGEKITSAKIFVQGSFNVGLTMAPTDQLPYTYNAVLVATTNSNNEGKLTLLPMTQFGTGNLDASKAVTWTGFGRILDFCPVGY